MDTYWVNWPKCQANKELKMVADSTIKYLKMYSLKKKGQGGKKDIIIFDIDDTLLFKDPCNVCDMECSYKAGNELVEISPPNPAICRIASEAKLMGYIIVIVTSRLPKAKEFTENNLRIFGIPFDAVIYNPCKSRPEGDYGCFKATLRRDLEKKYNIVATLGDQLTDVYCSSPYTAQIKLAEATSKCCYIYFPDL
jgi:predicted secreted acid phosphatase